MLTKWFNITRHWAPSLKMFLNAFRQKTHDMYLSTFSYQKVQTAHYKVCALMYQVMRNVYECCDFSIFIDPTDLVY